MVEFRSSVWILAGWSLLAVVSTALAAEPQDLPAARTSSAAPHSALQRARELLQAAKHLEAAGSHELARQVRKEAQALLNDERTRLAREQEELQLLSCSIGGSQVIVQAVLAEVGPMPPEMLSPVLREFGAKPLIAHNGDSVGQSVPMIFPKGVDQAAFWQRLKDDHPDLSVLSRPQVRTLDGQQAEIQVGREVTVVNGFTRAENGAPIAQTRPAFEGISLSMTPHVAVDGSIKMQLTATRNKFSEQSVPLYANPATGDVIESRIEDTTSSNSSVVVPAGRFVVIPQLLPGSSESDVDLENHPQARRDILLLMQATIADDQ